MLCGCEACAAQRSLVIVPIPALQVARGVVGLLQVASYPVLHNPARAAVQDLIYQVSGRRCAGDSFYILETLVFFGSTLAVAMMVGCPR